MDSRILIAGIAVALGGSCGGLALGRYAITDTSRASALASAADASEDVTNDSSATAADDTASNVPENYTCHGCGPTLAQRQMAAAEPHYPPPDLPPPQPSTAYDDDPPPAQSQTADVIPASY